MLRKIGLYFLSLWLLYILIIIITIQIPIDFSEHSSFVGFNYLISNNLMPIFCFGAITISFIAYKDFEYKMIGTPELSFEILEIEKIDYEHLTFLTTYIIPLVCFQFDDIRYVLVFFTLFLVIGLIYIRTDLFYANPTLAILKFRIYRIDGKFRNGDIRKSIIIICKDQLSKRDRLTYFRLDERIYYASKQKNNE